MARDMAREVLDTKEGTLHPFPSPGGGHGHPHHHLQGVLPQAPAAEPAPLGVPGNGPCPRILQYYATIADIAEQICGDTSYRPEGEDAVTVTEAERFTAKCRELLTVADHPCSEELEDFESCWRNCSRCTTGSRTAS